jgi:bacillithiol biosynthesis cysteine-adding enzyme BshC
MPMDCRAVLPQQLPHTTKLFGDYVSDFSKLAAFYSHPPDIHQVAIEAKKLQFPAERRRDVTEILRAQNTRFGSSAKAQENLDRLADGAVTIVSGQQVGLFGGPAFSFYKALSAIRTARKLSEEGIEAVPIFWMATEDHDIDEVRHTTWFTDGQLRRFELPKPAEPDVPVGRIPLGGEITDLVQEAVSLLTGPDSASLAEILQHAYTPTATYGTAFAHLFARIFADEGLILLDPLDERLHRLAAPIFCQALEQRDDLNALLLQRGKELERAGYAAQVNVTSRSTILFSLEGGQRHVISTNNNSDGFSGARHNASRQEWLQKVETSPELFSPNALFRPVLQDYMLPTAAYFGGPAEIAYYAQSQVLYEKLLGRMPVILPRADFTLVDPKAVRILKKYHLEVEDVWQGKQTLRKRMYGENVPKKLAREFDSNLRQMEKSTKKLHKAIANVDPTIQGTIARAEKRIHYQIEKLREKTGVALDRHDKIIDQHEQFLENLLYPQKGLQSRDLCFLPFLSRWGQFGLKELEKHAGAKHPGRHFLVPIP